MREHADLLSSVRDDITESKVHFFPGTLPLLQCWTGRFHCCSLCIVPVLTIFCGNPGQATGGMSPRVHLLRERASIHGSINQVFLELDKACAGLHFVYCSFSIPQLLSLPWNNLV
jgi:Golgi SNAP receptor complex protein 1